MTIITYLNSKYVDNFVRDFIPTLFSDAKYTGKLYVLGYDLTTTEKRMIMSLHHNIIIKDVTNDKAVEVQRNYDIINLLHVLDDEVVMTIDAGDVWFQDNFTEVFDICKDGIGIVKENEDCTEHWMGGKINQIADVKLQSMIKESLSGKLLIGSGMICANRLLLLDVLKDTVQLCNDLNEDYFGIDQIAFNTTLYNYYSDKIISLPHTYDYVIFQRLNPYYINHKKQIIEQRTNLPVKIVHNAGGDSRQYPHGRKDITDYRPHVTVVLPTKNRYYTTLALTISSIINQTYKPDKLYIIDDSDDRIDLRVEPTYKHLFAMLRSKGIDWEVLFGKRAGQHHSHQLGQEKAVELVYRVDDDVVIEPDVLEKLVEHFNDKSVGAVGGLILTAPLKVGSPNAKGYIEHSLWELNPQMFITPDRDIMEVDHLHCSFIFRKGINDYDLNLSPVAHREETLFSYGIKEAGYKVLIDKRVITWHLRNPVGGIRSHNNINYWLKDDEYYKDLMTNKGIKLDEVKVIYLNGGIGDTVVFRTLMPELVEKYKSNHLMIICPHPEMLKNYKDNDQIHFIGVDEGKVLVNNIEEYNVYGWMWKNNWTDSLENAFRKMCDLEVKK